MLRRTLFALLLGLALPASADSPWAPWFQVGLLGSSELARAETEVFLPWGNETTLGFLDLRGKAFTDDFDTDAFEGNAAFGVRHMMSREILGQRWNLGWWGGTDFRRSEADNDFWQVSTGIEALSEDWDLRVNGYAPWSDPKQALDGRARVEFTGSRIYVVGGAEVPLWGVDGEIGWRAPLESVGLDRDRHELRLFAGGFHFDDDEADEDVTGPRGRFEWRILDVIPSMPGSRLVASFEVQYDGVRHDQYQGGLQLRIPLSAFAFWRSDRPDPNAPRPTRLARRMVEPIVRDVDIVRAPSERERAEDALTGSNFDRVRVVNASDESISDGSDAAGTNSLLIANGDFTGSQKIRRDQTLQGGGSTILVRGRRSGSVARFRAPGSSASITHGGTSAVLRVTGRRAHVAGLEIVGGGDRTTSVADNRGIHVERGTFLGAFTDLHVRNTGEEGILLGGSGLSRVATFEDVRIEEVFGDGIAFEGDTGGREGRNERIGHFRKVRVRQSGGNGINLSGSGGGNDTVRTGRFEDVMIEDVDSEGIEISGSGSGGHSTRRLILRNVRIEDTGGSGVEITGSGSDRAERTMDLRHVKIRRTGSDAVDISGSADAFSTRKILLRDVDIDDVDGGAVRISGSADYRSQRVIDAQNVRIQNATGDGVWITGSGDKAAHREMRLRNVRIDDVDESAVGISGSGSGLRSIVLKDVTIRDTGEDAIRFQPGGGGVNDLTLRDVHFQGEIDDALVSAETGKNRFRGNAINGTSNDPSLCEGDFTGKLGFKGRDARVVENGRGCD